MSKCPYHRRGIALKEVKKKRLGLEFLKQDIMSSCPHGDTVIECSRGEYE